MKHSFFDPEVDRVYRDVDFWMDWAVRLSLEARYAVPDSPVIKEFDAATAARSLARRIHVKALTRRLELPGDGFTIWTRKGWSG